MNSQGDQVRTVAKSKCSLKSSTRMGRRHRDSCTSIMTKAIDKKREYKQIKSEISATTLLQNAEPVQALNKRKPS